ncbi:MAG: hypothetical protein V5B44_23325 [Candidatus Accumulibacter necessarius]|jgi:hypothetical protein|uniref:phosphoribosyltransferase-like protein n=1 Tax=Candidatus Accumulibacter necessarius TaxID=2954386 RepID=UPI002FC3388E
MRQLVIVCDLEHADKIRRALDAYGHPEAVKDLIDVFPLDMSVDVDRQRAKHDILALLRSNRSLHKLTNLPLLCATREAGRYLSLNGLAREMGYEYQSENARALCKADRLQGTPVVGRLLNQCNLSVRAFSASVLGNWAHYQIDRQWIDRWIQQFGRLGRFSWLGERLLRNLRMVDSAQLGKMLLGLRQDDEAAICVNRDRRATGKSGEVIANLLTKQARGRVHESPASAIEAERNSKLVLFEDGLWSGTEAIGVLESLLGRRDEGRLKTPPLIDPDILKTLDLTLAYGVATDYAESLVRRFLQNEGLSGVKIVASERVQIAGVELISGIDSGEFDLGKLWEEGPPSAFVKPYLVACLECDPALDNAQRSSANEFCREIGRQLFDNYLNAMCVRRGWSQWSETKRQKCGLGMHGLGLLHAFGHSVPKASSPLLWGSGKVRWKNATLDWHPPVHACR